MLLCHGVKNYLVFQPIQKTITYFSALPDTKSEWKPNGLSNKKFTPPYTENKGLSPKLIWKNCRIRLKFEGSCLKQENKTPFIPSNAVSLFILYELELRSGDLNTNFALIDCVFGSVKLTKNADQNKHKYSGYGLGFNLRSKFSIPGGIMGRRAIIFGVDMSSSVHIDNENKDVLIFGKGPTQELDNTTLTPEEEYSITL